MTTDTGRELAGSFDDVPDVELRTVLAVPISLVPLPAGAPEPVLRRPPAHGGRARQRHRHRRAAVRSEPHKGPVETLRLGLSAAVTVFVAVVLVLLAVQILVR